ncbi:MAG: hypothetical protein E7073_10040 [Bacteroidales bacterium]|nr:hypothetical protein [Bacteroidales bacterium]
MRHDNAKILGFGLLALAAVLALRKPAVAGIGMPRNKRATPARMKKIQAVDKMLREHYSSIYTNAEKHNATSTTSKYYKFKDGNVFVEIRNGDHPTRSMPCNYLAAVNLYELTGKGRSVQEAFQLAKNYIDKTVKLFK